MIYAPSHIKNYVQQIIGKNKFFDDDFSNDEFTFAYEIVCKCGNHKFTIYKNNEPKVVACCEVCNQKITLYDLIEYPCAVVLRKEKEEMELKKVSNEGNDRFNVAVIFEYSDEFSFDDEFDENDITWCQIYLYDPKNLCSIMIVDDVTA